MILAQHSHTVFDKSVIATRWTRELITKFYLMHVNVSPKMVKIQNVEVVHMPETKYITIY